MFRGHTRDARPRTESPMTPAALLDLTAVAERRKLRLIPIMNVSTMVRHSWATLPRAIPARGEATAMPRVKGAKV